MRKCFLLLLSIFCIVSCTTKQKKEEKRELQNVTLSFNNITIGADTASIDSSCFENSLDVFFDYDCRPKDAMRNLLTENENVFRSFSTSLVTDNKTKIPLFVNVYEKDGKVSKILCVASSDTHYSDIFELFQKKYGDPFVSEMVDLGSSSKVFSLHSNRWDFQNSLGLFIQVMRYTGNSYGEFAQIAAVARNIECVIIAYCDMKPIQDQQKADQEKQAKEKSEAEEEKARERAELQNQMNNQDI